MIDLKTFGSEFWYSSNKFRDLFKKTSEFALSFNGYEYWGDRGYHGKEGGEKIYKNKLALLNGDKIPEDELLPQLFFTQRNLAKGQYEINDKTYKVFYKLFLECIEKKEEIPTKYRNEEYFEKWKKTRGDLPHIIENVKNIIDSVNWK